MADVVQRTESINVRSRTDWGAIWAGMFTFIAIWSVFGLLGSRYLRLRPIRRRQIPLPA